MPLRLLEQLGAVGDDESALASSDASADELSEAPGLAGAGRQDDQRALNAALPLRLDAGDRA
jgi:hypothetical protein